MCVDGWLKPGDSDFGYDQEIQNDVDKKFGGTDDKWNIRLIQRSRSVATAVSIAEANVEKARMRTYVILASRISTGTKPLAKVDAPPTNAMLMINPRNA